jgi:1-phosphofructokinase family hexose kinase
MIWCVTLNPALDVSYRLSGDLAPGAINLANAMDAQLGGKGNNVARTVRALGEPVAAVQILGGAIGLELFRRAQDLDISIVSEVIPDDSRVCITVISPAGAVTELRPPGPTVDPRVADALLDQLASQLALNDWVTLSGSLPQGLGADTYARWVERLNPLCAGIIVDTSGAPLKLALAAGPAAIVPNRSEFAAVGGNLRADKTHVVITDGAQGVEWLAADGNRRYFQAPPVSVVNPVGAGDAFLGGLVWALASQKLSFGEAVAQAMGVAGASVEMLGVAQFDRARSMQLTAQIREGL